MSELTFFAFCITVIALTAISKDKDKVAEKALSAIANTVGDFATLFEKIFVNIKNEKVSSKGESSNKPANEKRKRSTRRSHPDG